MRDDVPRRRRLGSGLAAALALGLLVGLLGGEPRRVSVEVWLAVATAWSAWLVMGELVAVAPLRPDRIELLLPRRRRGAQLDERARRLANLEGLIANAAHSPRAATVRLRPRLAAVTDELLHSRHGIDRAADPDAAAAVLGDVGWLVDPTHDMVRSPTPAEVELLVARAEGDGLVGRRRRSGPSPDAVEPTPEDEE